MKKLLILISIITILSMIGGRAIAVPVYFGDGGASLQGVLDGITVSPSGSSSVNVTTDVITEGNDSHWSIAGVGAAVETIVVELAAWSNDNLFGIYDASNMGNSVQIFGGGANAGDQAVISIKTDGSVFLNFVDTSVDFTANKFGFYLDASSHSDFQPDSQNNYWNGGIWYSDTRLNADNKDHMYAYQGTGDQVQLPGLAEGKWSPSEYVLAFEDLHYNHWGDQDGTDEGYPEWSDTEPDFTDFVVMVESVNPVPEPSTIFLIASLVCTMIGLNRKKFIV